MAFDRIRENRNKKTVILDTNAVLMLFEFNINLEDELSRLIGLYRIMIPSTVEKELKILSKKYSGNKKIYAKAAIKLINKYEKMNVKSDNADDSIFLLAKKIDNCFVLTNDKELKDRIKKIPRKVIFLRAKKKLEII